MGSQSHLPPPAAYASQTRAGTGAARARRQNAPSGPRTTIKAGSATAAVWGGLGPRPERAAHNTERCTNPCMNASP